MYESRRACGGLEGGKSFRNGVRGLVCNFQEGSSQITQLFPIPNNT